MTPEELNHTMEFIVASQARLAAAQEHDRQDRVAFERRLADLQRQQAELLVHQSERMDSFQRFYGDWLKRTDGFQVQALRLLHMILDRLPPIRQT